MVQSAHHVTLTMLRRGWMTALSLSELSRRTTDVKRLLAESPVVVTDNGYNIGALIGLDLWARQEWLEDEEDNRAADAMMVNIKAGEETYSHEEVWARIDALEAAGALPD